MCPGGGVLCQEGASPAIENCRFIDNVGGPGAKGAAIGGERESSPRIDRCTFEGNAVEGEGGAIFFLGSSSSPEIRQCTFAANRSDTCGGAVGFKAVSADCQLHLALCTFIGNEAGGGGGGAIWFIAAEEGDLVVDGCTFSENSAPVGSAVVCSEDVHLAMDNTIIAQGLQGEAIACIGDATATVACSDIWDNDGGDWVGCIEYQFPGNNNFHEDPRFCGVQNPEAPYSLHSSSPLFSSFSTCGPIGAWPVGCGDMSEAPLQPSVLVTWTLSSPRPNPFTLETGLVLGAPPGVELSIEVFDPAGRRVRILADDVDGGSLRTVSWDGRDDLGLLQRSGIYFIRLRADGVSEGQPVLLLR